MRKALLVIAALAIFSLVLMAAAYIDAFLIEPHWLKVERFSIVHPGLAGTLDDLTFVQLSDIHIQKPAGFLEKSILDELMRLKPDIIFITGDFVSRRYALRHLWEFVSEMKPAVWVYGTPGDSDEELINDRWKDEGWKKAGMALLVDEVVPLVWPRTGGKRLWLVAAQPSFDWTRVTETAPPGEPVIVLAHKPDTVKEAALAGADLVLAGDTHGTQVGIEALRGFSSYAKRSRYTEGIYRVKDTLLYVNRGTGWRARPMRFFCRPELTVFQFRPAGKMDHVKVLPGDE